MLDEHIKSKRKRQGSSSMNDFTLLFSLKICSSQFGVMSARPLDILVAYRHQHPASFFLATAAIVLALGFWAALEFFKPVGKRTAKNGTKPRLPPGPRGVPLLGSLGDLLHPTRSQVSRCFLSMRLYINDTETFIQHPNYANRSDNSF